MRTSRNLPLFAFAFLSFLWGSTWIAIKLGLSDMPPFTASGIRLVLAALILDIYRRLIKVPAPRGRGAHLLLVVVGLTLFGLPYGFIYWGQQYVTSGMASVLFAALPFFVAIEAHFLVPGEKLTARKIVGVTVGFSGIVVIFWERLFQGGINTIPGMIAVLVSSFLSGFGSVIGRRYSRDYHPVVLNSLPMFYGGLLLLAAAAGLERNRPLAWTPTSVGALVYLTVLGSCVAFVLYFWLLQKREATTVSLIALVTPITALVLGRVILHEKISTHLASGASLVGLGIILATRTSSRWGPFPALGAPREIAWRPRGGSTHGTERRRKNPPPQA